ncbi:interaptin-like isoform X2 [Periplaneta americana]|uniref:interaptin-like isoform X2 n=1 Tax=Periplaneta americana TaxID=6978 RepID=UPI0037E8E57C
MSFSSDSIQRETSVNPDMREEAYLKEINELEGNKKAENSCETNDTSAGHVQDKVCFEFADVSKVKQEIDKDDDYVKNTIINDYDDYMEDSDITESKESNINSIKKEGTTDLRKSKQYNTFFKKSVLRNGRNGSNNRFNNGRHTNNVRGKNSDDNDTIDEENYYAVRPEIGVECQLQNVQMQKEMYLQTLQRRREYYKNQTDQKRQQILQKRRENYRQNKTKQTEEERQQILQKRRENYRKQTEEQRQRILQKRRENYRKQTEECRHQTLLKRRANYLKQVDRQRQQISSGRRERYCRNKRDQLYSGRYYAGITSQPHTLMGMAGEAISVQPTILHELYGYGTIAESVLWLKANSINEESNSDGEIDPLSLPNGDRIPVMEEVTSALCTSVPKGNTASSDAREDTFSTRIKNWEDSKKAESIYEINDTESSTGDIQGNTRFELAGISKVKQKPVKEDDEKDIAIENEFTDHKGSDSNSIGKEDTFDFGEMNQYNTHFMSDLRMIDSYIRPSYEDNICSMCNKIFDDIFSLAVHYQIHVEEGKGQNTQEAGETAKSLSTLCSNTFANGHYDSLLLTTNAIRPFQNAENIVQIYKEMDSETLQRRKEYYEKLMEERRQQVLKRRRENYKKNKKRQTEEERKMFLQKRREDYNRQTEEQRQRMLQKRRENYRKNKRKKLQGVKHDTDLSM